MTTTPTQPASHSRTGAAGEPGGSSPERLARANINPDTGLATDYLNHFNEAIMLLDLVTTAPDILPDLMAWRPMSYQDHFAGSRFKDRALAVCAYEAAAPAARGELERLADTMTTILLATRDAMMIEGCAVEMAGEALKAAGQLRPLVAKTGAVINSRATGQGTVDALFER
jgi:hypothetical protein